MKKITLLAAVFAVLGFAGSLSVSTSTYAHARYASSSPAVGEILAVGPDSVEITFTQEIQRIAGGYGIEVNKDRGMDVTAGDAAVNDDDRTKLSVPLQPDLEDGRYVVRWKNVSDEDGDPAEGAFSFYINVEPNAVDLANDADLALIGQDDATPAPTATPGDGAAPPPVVTEPAGAATSTPVNGDPADDNSDDGDSTTVILVGVGAIIGLALGGAGYFFWRNRAG
jgi:methionine-rich copper-binding protein CopC